MPENNPRKILVINGSPKRESSFTLNVTKAFVGGMELEGQCVTEYINIPDLDIRPCRGCLSCWARTAGECVIKDDQMPMLKEKIENADFVIESYPLYFFGMPGIVKIFTDRLLGMLATYNGKMADADDGAAHRLRNPKEGQRLAVISSCGFSEGSDVFEPLKAQYDLILGKNNYTMICCPQLKALIEAGSEQRVAAYMKKMENAGRMFMRQGFLDSETAAEVSKPPFLPKAYRALVEKFWQDQETGGKNN